MRSCRSIVNDGTPLRPKLRQCTNRAAWIIMEEIDYVGGNRKEPFNEPGGDHVYCTTHKLRIEKTGLAPDLSFERIK